MNKLFVAPFVWGDKLICIKMKRILILSVMFCTFCDAFAQWITVDIVKYRFHYATKVTLIEGNKLRDDEINVDIGNKTTYCYSRWSEEGALTFDSIMANGGNVADYLAMGLPVSSFGDRVLKNYPQAGRLTITCYEGKDLYYEEPIAKKDWKLEEGDTTIIGYPCKKASCRFRGRTWHCWYAMDIPFSEGPWKLDGLPGMILKAQDEKNQFIMECIGIKKDVNKPMISKLTKRVKTTPQYVEKLRNLKEKNWAAFKKLVGLNWIDGMSDKPANRVACHIEYYNKK